MRPPSPPGGKTGAEAVVAEGSDAAVGAKAVVAEDNDTASRAHQRGKGLRKLRNGTGPWGASSRNILALMHWAMSLHCCTAKTVDLHFDWNRRPPGANECHPPSAIEHVSNRALQARSSGLLGSRVYIGSCNVV